MKVPDAFLAKLASGAGDRARSPDRRLGAASPTGRGAVIETKVVLGGVT